MFSFPINERENKVRKLLNKLKHSNLRKLASEANSALLTCEDHIKRWYDLLIDTFFH